jgi:hypothetical protein
MANATVDGKTLSEKERTRSKLMTPARRSNFQKTKDEDLQKLADEIDPQPLGYSERMNDFTKDMEIKSGRQVVEENNTKKMAKGGSVSSRADGCCVKGKTKGKMIAMNRGGKAC